MQFQFRWLICDHQVSTSKLAVETCEGCYVSKAEPRVAVRAAFTGIKDERHLSHSLAPLFLFLLPSLSLFRACDWFGSLRLGEGELIIAIKWSMLLPLLSTPAARQWSVDSSEGRRKGWKEWGKRKVREDIENNEVGTGQRWLREKQ